MKRALLISGLALAAWLTSAGSAADSQPVLRSAALLNGHVVVTFTVGDDLRPGVIQIATRPTAGPTGSFLGANVMLSEAITAKPDPATGLVRWRTVKALPYRTYYVHVSGIEVSDVIPNCTPKQPNCRVHWSNVRVVSSRAAAA